MSLFQVILPIDLAMGGVIRPSLTESEVAAIVSYKLILSSFYKKKFFFKTFRKIFNYPYKYLLYKIKIFFLIDKINLDVDRPSSYLKDNVLKNTNDLKLDDFFILVHLF